jgi:N-terminal domain on NACHT_NTPase and P-loop NTPases/NB-ARC domain
MRLAPECHIFCANLEGCSSLSRWRCSSKRRDHQYGGSHCHVSLVASIGSLIDLSAKVVSRLHEFTSKTSDLPDSFRSLSIRLPLLTAALQRIQTQAITGRLPDDATKVLTAVVDSTFKHVSTVQTCLSKMLPPDGASKLERALKALKSLAKEDKVQQAVEKIHKDIDVLVLHQTTRNVDTSDRILEELSKLSAAPLVSSQSLGVCLGQAPTIPPDAFIGRTRELQQLQDWLLPASHPHRQYIVSIVGMGGMGKTQLSLAHVRDCGDDYSSVFWVNAKDETSLRQGMAELSAVIFPDLSVAATQSADDEQLKIAQVRRWLSEVGNDQWLLIFDNYDDPCLPGIRSTTGYDIRSFFPTRSQGSIVITSRSTKLAFSKTLKLQRLEDAKTSVVILSQRAGQDLSHGELLC